MYTFILQIYVRTLYEHVDDLDGYLSFKAGQVIRVLSMNVNWGALDPNNPEWLWGELRSVWKARVFLFVGAFNVHGEWFVSSRNLGLLLIVQDDPALSSLSHATPKICGHFASNFVSLIQQ